MSVTRARITALETIAAVCDHVGKYGGQVPIRLETYQLVQLKHGVDVVNRMIASLRAGHSANTKEGVAAYGSKFLDAVHRMRELQTDGDTLPAVQGIAEQTVDRLLDRAFGLPVSKGGAP